jgi:hypothetical protein
MNMQPQGLKIDNPFAPVEPSHGMNAMWVMRGIEEPDVLLSDEMDHYDAMRVDLDPRKGTVISRVDALHETLVTGRGHDDRHLTAPTMIDVTPALKSLTPQDFVDIQSEDFAPGGATARLLDELETQGDPRAGRLRLYEREWSSPDEAGRRAKACLYVDEYQLMAWCEKHRPEIHEELLYRKEAATPSYTD